MPCLPPATKDGRGYVNLCPTNVANGADQARRVIITTNQLVISGAETPQVAALAKGLWAGIVEMILDLVVQREGGWGAPRCRMIGVMSSAGVPFRRCDYDCGRFFPTPVASALFLRIYQGMGRVPGRTSLICIPQERMAKSVQPEIHVCPVVGCPGGGSLLFAGDRAAFSLWIWCGLSSI